MVRIVVLTLAALISVAACSPSSSASPSGAPTSNAPTASGGGVDAAEIGRQYVEALAAGDAGTAVELGDPAMQSAAPAAVLEQLWRDIQVEFGAYDGIVGVETAEEAPYVTATVTASFANATVPLLVAVDKDGRVAGFRLGEPEYATSSSAPAASPAYIDPSAFTETDVTVGEAPWELPGTLSMPAGDGPFPAVVLVAGSGPQDRDEAIGPNTPLRDLAWGLASNGIAVLRYDKRTAAHAAEMAADAANVTVQEETVDDAVTAVDLLRETPRIDPERVFVVGHSLGGYLAPRIAGDAAGRVAGIGILEGSTSPLQDLIIDQYEYLASPEGGADPSAAAALPTVREQVALVDSADLTASTPATSLPLGIPAAYWLDLRDYDAAATAAGLDIPMFISQGGRDYQVPPSELEGWRAALADRDDVTIREYPALNHLLMEGSGPSQPAEYGVAGHVAEDVVRDLAGWLTDANR